MTDQELLEKAARAVGNNAEWSDDLQAMHWPGLQSMGVWNPLEDDGDAFRLMCQLNMNVFTDDSWVTDNMINISTRRGGMIGQDWDDEIDDFNALTRRAIVRAAAAIGEQS